MITPLPPPSRRSATAALNVIARESRSASRSADASIVVGPHSAAPERRPPDGRVDGDDRVETRARAALHVQLLVVQRLQVAIDRRLATGPVHRGSGDDRLTGSAMNELRFPAPVDEVPAPTDAALAPVPALVVPAPLPEVRRPPGAPPVPVLPPPAPVPVPSYRWSSGGPGRRPGGAGRPGGATAVVVPAVLLPVVPPAAPEVPPVLAPVGVEELVALEPVVEPSSRCRRRMPFRCRRWARTSCCPGPASRRSAASWSGSGVWPLDALAVDDGDRRSRRARGAGRRAGAGSALGAGRAERRSGLRRGRGDVTTRG